MNRTIKFRGQDAKGFWHYGYFSKDYVGTCYITTLDGVDTSIVIESTVGQYAEKHDNEGKDIFEGDLISCLNSKEADGIIVWCDIDSMFKIKWISKIYKQVRGQNQYYTENGEKLFHNSHLVWTVIGNIHESEVKNG
ncbi:YopX family protein [Sphingobacterium faecium]|uniref:YopX family protein n=1 Tax=Sphingobacterium faecium TaxID=34087 RepID=UPI00247A121D|nr:YopX family protein [Sphingobacterium faecium]WGQ15600.1 YopX family protein [Sphingobacterium faecium]